MTALELANVLVAVAGIYLALGLLFAVPFSLAGAAKIDPGAREGTWGFKLIVLPGAVALWPLLLRRWIAGRPEPPAESNAHRRAARPGPG
jgi:hypothetical protein